MFHVEDRIHERSTTTRASHEAPPPPSPTSSSLRINENMAVARNSSDVAAGPGTRGAWSDDVLDVVALLGEGASGTVQAVQDKRTGLRFARKTIITREGPLKQLVRELALLSGLRYTNIVRFYGAYMSCRSWLRSAVCLCPFLFPFISRQSVDLLSLVIIREFVMPLDWKCR
jgi:serine/threonine protein kinase